MNYLLYCVMEIESLCNNQNTILVSNIDFLYGKLQCGHYEICQILYDLTLVNAKMVSVYI